MAEWSIASVLKTEVLKGTGGSNPSLSAKKEVSFSSFFAGMAELAYALDLGSSTWGFESLYRYHKNP